MGTTTEAMALFKLRHRQVFANAAVGARLVIAWNDSMAVLCARGSQKAANFVHDAKVRVPDIYFQRPASKQSHAYGSILCLQAAQLMSPAIHLESLDLSRKMKPTRLKSLAFKVLSMRIR